MEEITGVASSICPYNAGLPQARPIIYPNLQALTSETGCAFQATVN
jgi:hypothetical protein